MSALADIISRLEAEAARTEPSSPISDRLPLSAIRELHEAFQHRRLDEHHVQQLRGALKRGEPLEALTVFQAGPTTYLIDGHHRREAYRREKWAQPVPVCFFQGAAAEAVAEGGRLNSRAKLPMTLQERNDLAWRLVNCPRFSKAQIVEAASVSDGQVAVMRRVKRALGEEAADYESWFKASRAAKGMVKDWDAGDIEEWKRERARQIAEKLHKQFGSKPVSNPEVFAMALELMFGDRIGVLTRFLPQPEHEMDEDAEF